MRHKLSAFSSVFNEYILKKKIKWSVRYDYYEWQTIDGTVDLFIID